MESSSESGQEVCSSCGKRAANNYICYGRKGKSAKLCDECFSSVDPISASFAAEMKSAKCHYCGGTPCGGGSDTISQITGGSSEKLWLCMSCSPEYYSFIQMSVATIPDGLTQKELIARHKEIATQTEAHMVAFVKRRDN